MIRLRSVRLLVLLLLLALFLPSSAWAAWGRGESGHQGDYIVTAPDGTVWSTRKVSNLISIEQYNGSTWQNIGSPAWGASSYIPAMDADGSLWFISLDGSVHEFKNGSINYVSRWPYRGSYQVDTAVFDSNGDLWVSTDEGTIYKFNGSTWTSIPTANTKPGNKLNFAGGKIWFTGTSPLAYYWNNGSWIATNLGIDPYRPPIIFDGPDGSIWAISQTYNGNSGYLHKFNGTTWEQKIYLPGGSNNGKGFYDAQFGPNGMLYILSNYGKLMEYNPINNTISDLPFYAIGFYINDTMSIDQSGKIWARVYSNIYYFNDGGINISTTSATQTTVNLSFNWDGDKPLDSFIAEISTDGTNFSNANSLSGTSGTVTGLAPGTKYWIRLYKNVPTKNGGATYRYLSNTITVRTIPPTPLAPTGTNSLVQWSNTTGRGKVQLNWTAVKGATGYKVWVLDGSQYRSFDVGNVSSWNSSVAKIYPDPSWLNSQAENSISSNPFNTAGGGFELQDTPNIIYKKTVGTTYDSATNYWFRVSAYNESGESPLSTGTYSPTLPNATDISTPSGTVNVISNEGLKKTFNQNVKVAVNINDSLSGVYQILLSNDNITFSPAYTATKNGTGSTGVATYNNTFDWTTTLGGGTKLVYVKAVDAVGNSIILSDSIALAEDMLPPSISLLVNNGSSSTTSNNVSLTLSVSDNASVSSQMQMSFSNNGTLWSTWEPYQITKDWNITNSTFGGTAGAGKKKVYSRIYDQAQNIGFATAEIGYNPTPPTANSLTIINGVSGTYNGKPVVFLKGDMPTLQISASGASRIRYDIGFGWSDWEDYATSKDIVLAKSSGTCKVRYQVEDTYGVKSEAKELLVVVDSQPPVVQIATVSGARATSGSTIKIKISAVDNKDPYTDLQYSIYGTNYYPMPADGVISVAVDMSPVTAITVAVKDTSGNVGTDSILIRKL